jgi:hypothetical protein
MTTNDLILTIVSQANQLRLAIEAIQQLQARIAELEKAEQERTPEPGPAP